MPAELHFTDVLPLGEVYQARAPWSRSVPNAGPPAREDSPSVKVTDLYGELCAQFEGSITVEIVGVGTRTVFDGWSAAGA